MDPVKETLNPKICRDRERRDDGKRKARFAGDGERELEGRWVAKCLREKSNSAHDRNPEPNVQLLFIEPESTCCSIARMLGSSMRFTRWDDEG